MNNVCRMRFRERAIKKGIRKWRNFIKQVKTGNIAEEESNEFYYQKLLAKYFNNWVLFSLEICFNFWNRKQITKK